MARMKAETRRYFWWPELFKEIDNNNNNNKLDNNNSLLAILAIYTSYNPINIWNLFKIIHSIIKYKKKKYLFNVIPSCISILL